MPTHRNLLRRVIRTFATASAALLIIGCNEDEIGGGGLDISAVVVEPGRVEIRARNTGSRDGYFTGCSSGPLTSVQQWDGSRWVEAFEVNRSCSTGPYVDLELTAGEELTYAFPMPSGRFRFRLWLLLGDQREVISTSNAVDVI